MIKCKTTEADSAQIDLAAGVDYRGACVVLAIETDREGIECVLRESHVRQLVKHLKEWLDA